jgi:hypothetical protein
MEKDMNKVGRYFLNVALGLDHFANAAIWGGSAQETISSRIGRIKEANGGKVPWSRPWPRIMDWALDKLQKDHCIRAIERNDLQQIHDESVFDGDVDTGVHK